MKQILLLLTLISPILLFNGCTKVQPLHLKIKKSYPPDIPKYKIVVKNDCICGKSKTLALKVIKELRGNDSTCREILDEIYKLGDN